MRSARLALAVIVLSLSAHAAAPPPAGAPDEASILGHLNRAVRWWRSVAALQQAATEPSDVVFAADARAAADKALPLAFQFARAAAALQAHKAAGSGSAQAAPAQSSAQRLADLAQKAQARLEAAQADVKARRDELAAAPHKERPLAQARLTEAQSELQLARARAETLESMASFIARAGASSGEGLLDQIAQLQRSVPRAEAPANATSNAHPAAANAQPASRPAEPRGMVGLAEELFSLSRLGSELRDDSLETSELRSALEKVRAPLVAEVRAILQQADAAGSPDLADAGELAQRSRDLDALTARFKAVSAALVPLGEEAALVDSAAATLEDWHRSADRRSATSLRSLALRLGLLFAAIVVVLIGSELWRRATFRYVKDARRRQQSMLVRRILVTSAVLLLVVFSLINELGSLATFAGFITAGLAVALQNVILSVAAYFFLIGRYGIRVGDRVQIGDVQGEVIDLGLVRMHVMELREGAPTGRVVVYSNATVFSGNFFKQLPGSNFAWHQVRLTLSADSDYRLAEHSLMAAVESVYATFRDELVAQHERVAQTLSITVAEPRPTSQLHFTDSGLEMIIRFAVPLARAAEVDDRVTKAVLDAIAREPRLKMAGTGKPTIETGAAASAAAPAPAAH